jgi:transcriptional regulator with XRE-family HTH domain
MDIKQLKKELGLSQNELAEFFQMSYGSYANSTAKNGTKLLYVTFTKWLRIN